MSLLSGGEGIRSEDCFVFVPCSFPVWDAVLFSYVRKAVNLPRMDRLLASTCPVSHLSALSPHRRIRRCREPTPEWLRTSKSCKRIATPHMLPNGAVRNDHLAVQRHFYMTTTGWKLDGNWRGHASRAPFCLRPFIFWRIFIVHFGTYLNTAEYNRL